MGSFSGSRDPQGRAAHRHPYIYDPKVNWRNGEIAARQIAGHDMERRLKDIKKEGIDKQVIFPTGINVATENIGGLGLRLRAGVQQLGGEASEGTRGRVSSSRNDACRLPGGDGG